MSRTARKPTPAQRRLLKSLARWGEFSPDCEYEVGCVGAAFDAVFDAVLRHGYAVERTEGGCTFIELTDAGRAVIACNAA